MAAPSATPTMSSTFPPSSPDSGAKRVRPGPFQSGAWPLACGRATITPRARKRSAWIRSANPSALPSKLCSATASGRWTPAVAPVGRSTSQRTARPPASIVSASSPGATVVRSINRDGDVGIGPAAQAASIAAPSAPTVDRSHPSACHGAPFRVWRTALVPLPQRASSTQNRPALAKRHDALALRRRSAAVVQADDDVAPELGRTRVFEVGVRGLHVTPACLAADEEIGLCREARVLVQRACGHAYGAIGGRDWSDAAAGLAESAVVAGRRLKSRDLIFTRQPAKTRPLDLKVDAVLASRDLSAVGAETSDRRGDARFVDFKPKRATEARALDHDV